MQRTIRILRILLPILFVGFLGLIYANWHRGKVKRDKTSTEAVATTRPNDKALLESKQFEDTQSIGGRVTMRIHATRYLAYKSDWNTLEDVQLTIYRPNGLTYNLVCPTAEFNSSTKVANAKGGVKLVSTDGVTVTTAEIHYDGSRLTNHIPVQFTIDRWHGNAGALDLDVPNETLRLFEKMDAAMSPEPDEQPMSVRGQEGVFRRKENDVAFTQDVVITHGPDRMQCDRTMGRFSPDRKKLQALDGSGHVVMIMAANPGPNEDLGGKKTITCERFTSEVGPTGDISAINCFGDNGYAHALLDGPPKRDVVAKAFRVALVNRAVSEMKVDWEVVMKELEPLLRQINADHVTVGFDAATHKATTANIETFKYKDPKNSAAAVRAIYDILNDRVILSAEPGYDPTVVSEGQTVKAKLIEFSPKAGTAKATGDVIAQLLNKQGTGVGADGTTLFPAGKPVFVNSDALLLRQTNKIAVFSGKVRAWQETNTLFAQEMQVQNGGESVTARGGVRTILYNAQGDARKTPVLTSSDQLVARKNDRRIDLTGSVKIDDEQRTMTGEKASFFFDAGKKIERIEAENKIVLVDHSTNRKLTGEKATYLVAKRMIYVSGQPATATAPNGTVSGQQIAFDLARNKVEVMSPPTSQTQGSYKP